MTGNDYAIWDYNGKRGVENGSYVNNVEKEVG